MPALGRLPSVDPLYTGAVEDPQRWNRYAYALNSPLVYIDPDGRAAACTGTGDGQRFTGGCRQQPTHPAFVQEHSPDLFLLMQYGDYGYHNGNASGVNMAEWDVATQRPSAPQGQIVMAVDPVVIDLPLIGTVTIEPGLDMPLTPLPAAAVAKPVATAAGTMTRRITEGMAEAAERFARKAGKLEWHHIVPKYLGGDANGVMIRLDAAYHQLITNEFRKLAPYGRRPTAQEVKDIISEVYSLLPLPPTAPRR